MKKNRTNKLHKRVDGLRNIAIYCRICLFSLLLFVSLNQVKAQAPDVITEDIKFKSTGVCLAGTIYKPQHSQAAVVIVHGSDRQPRMRTFASLLAKNGISVLTYDKRGVGESGGVYVGPEVGTNNVNSANLTLLAEDANAAVNVLHQRDKNVPIGLIGFSQAGWIIPIAANNNSLVDFMILFSGSVVPTLEQLRFQFFTEGKPDFWDTHTEAQAREHIRNDADRYQFANTDPYEALSTLSIPGLWLFGDQDVQIPVGLSIERLNTLKAQGKPYEYCLFPALGHNVGFSDAAEPVNIAVHWMKDRKHCRAERPTFNQLTDSCFTYFFAGDTGNFNRLYPRMTDAYEKQYDPAAYTRRHQLLALREEDQGIRLLLLEARKRYGGTSPQAQAIHARMKQIDRTNAQLVQQIIDKNEGWPAKEDIGEDAAEAVFLCIQHVDDLTVQEKYLPMLRLAVEAGAAEGWHYAFLIDRIRMNRGEKQVYGTQTITRSNGELDYVVPLEDPDRVDSLRQQVGLEPMRIYLDGKWDSEAYKRNLPAIEQKYKAFINSRKSAE